jgi:hypothetical protein
MPRSGAVSARGNCGDGTTAPRSQSRASVRSRSTLVGAGPVNAGAGRGQVPAAGRASDRTTACLESHRARRPCAGAPSSCRFALALWAKVWRWSTALGGAGLESETGLSRALDQPFRDGRRANEIGGDPPSGRPPAGFLGGTLKRTRRCVIARREKVWMVSPRNSAPIGVHGQARKTFPVPHLGSVCRSDWIKH